MSGDALETVLHLVAEGRITAEEAVPLIAALGDHDAPAAAEPDRPERSAAEAGAGAGAGETARQVRVEVTERGRTVVNLRVPLTLGQAAVSYVPGLDAIQSARVKEALAKGVTGPILELLDDDGDGVRIVLE
jgi:hypothetical protein